MRGPLDPPERAAAWIGLVEIGADHRGIADGEIAVDQHRDPAKRAQPLEFVIAVERRDRVDLVVEALQVHGGEHLAHIGADEAADDPDGAGHEDRICRSAGKGLDTLQM